MHHRISIPRHTRLLLAILTTTVVFAITVTTASANNFQVSNQQFRAVWRNLELFNTAVEGTVRCPVTIEGSFHGRTIVKTRGLLVGYLTTASAANEVCTGGHVTILRELLPWHLTYNSFTGTLPNIAGITFNLIRDGILIQLGGNGCRTLTTTANPARAIATIGAGGRIEGLRLDESVAIPLTNGPGGQLCSIANGIDRGTGTVTLLGNNNTISVTLI